MLRLLALLTLMTLSFFGEAAQVVNTSKLNWMTNYEEALARSKKEKKPVLLFFTGSDWCGWCHKLENEALSTIDFSDAASDRFIFVMVDFPLKSPLEPNLSAQNKELQKKFDVKGFPTIILIDESQQQIGVTGYRPGGGKAYADHLLKMAEDFKGYKQKVSSLNRDELKPKELVSLYGKAKELCRPEEASRIVKAGLKCEENRFFLLERYRILADEGQIHDPEAQSIRTELLAQDKDNGNKTHYEVAVIEFEAFSEEMEKENYAPEIAVAPLVAYIERFGEQDEENLWRLQMIIAQVYLDKDRPKEAVKYAKAAHASAPESIQSDILAFIQNINVMP